VSPDDSWATSGKNAQVIVHPSPRPLLLGHFFVYVWPFKKMGVIRVAEKSAIQRIKDLDAERASIFDHAKEEALEKAKAAVAELNGLGFNYTLTSTSFPKFESYQAA
jgi:hypothetical protein